MEDELPVAEPDHRRANGNRNQPGQPTEVVLGAPEIPVVLNQCQWSDSRLSPDERVEPTTDDGRRLLGFGRASRPRTNRPLHT
jgi:hypothetical protein